MNQEYSLMDQEVELAGPRVLTYWTKQCYNIYYQIYHILDQTYNLLDHDLQKAKPTVKILGPRIVTKLYQEVPLNEPRIRNPHFFGTVSLS